MSRSGIHWTVGEKSVLLYDMLDVGEKGRCEDLRDFDNGGPTMAMQVTELHLKATDAHLVQ